MTLRMDTFGMRYFDSVALIESGLEGRKSKCSMTAPEVF